MGKRPGLDSKFICHLLVTLRKLTSAYCSLLNIEKSFSHCEINGFLPPVPVSVILFSQVIIWNPTWFSVWETEKQSKKMRYGEPEKEQEGRNTRKGWSHVGRRMSNPEEQNKQRYNNFSVWKVIICIDFSLQVLKFFVFLSLLRR